MKCESVNEDISKFENVGVFRDLATVFQITRRMWLIFVPEIQKISEQLKHWVLAKYESLVYL